MNTIPAEIYFHLFSYLDFPNLGRLSLTSRGLNGLISAYLKGPGLVSTFEAHGGANIAIHGALVLDNEKTLDWFLKGGHMGLFLNPLMNIPRPIIFKCTQYLKDKNALLPLIIALKIAPIEDYIAISSNICVAAFEALIVQQGGTSNAFIAIWLLTYYPFLVRTIDDQDLISFVSLIKCATHFPNEFESFILNNWTENIYLNRMEGKSSFKECLLGYVNVVHGASMGAISVFIKAIKAYDFDTANEIMKMLKWKWPALGLNLT